MKSSMMSDVTENTMSICISSSDSSSIKSTELGASSRKKLHRFLELRPVQLVVIGLTGLDIVLVMLEILIANGTIGKLNPCESQLEDHQRQIDELVAAAMAGGNDTHEGSGEHAMSGEDLTASEEAHHHQVERWETIEHVLHWSSISLLFVFLLENFLHIYVSPKAFFTSFFHIFDISVVIASIVLELVLHEGGGGGLIVTLRLVRIIQGVIVAEQEAHISTLKQLRKTARQSREQRKFLKLFVGRSKHYIIDREHKEKARELIFAGRLQNSENRQMMRDAKSNKPCAKYCNELVSSSSSSSTSLDDLMVSTWDVPDDAPGQERLAHTGELPPVSARTPKLTSHGKKHASVRGAIAKSKLNVVDDDKKPPRRRSSSTSSSLMSLLSSSGFTDETFVPS